MRVKNALCVESLESRSMLSVVTVLSGKEYHFVDGSGVDQHVAVWDGSARVALSDLPDGRHEILSVQLFGRGLATVDFHASSGVPVLNGRRVGDVEIGGDVGSFRALSVWGDVAVQGNLGRFQAALVDGEVHIDGSLGSLAVASFQYNDLRVEGDVTGTVQVLRNLGSLHVGLEYVEESDEYVVTGGLLRGALRVGGAMSELHIGGSAETAAVMIRGDLESLEVVSELAGSVRVLGSVDEADIGGDLRADLAIDGDLWNLIVSGNQPIVSELSVGGAAGAAEFRGDVAGQIALGSLDCELIIAGSLYGSVRVQGDAGRIAVGVVNHEESEEFEFTGAILFGDIFVGGDLDELELGGGSAETATVTVEGDLDSLFSWGDVAGTIEVGGDLGEFDTWGQMLGKLAVRGDLGFLIASFGQAAESVIEVGGWVGGMEFGADVDGQITAEEIDYVLIDGCLHGSISGADPENIIELCLVVEEESGE